MSFPWPNASTRFNSNRQAPKSPSNPTAQLFLYVVSVSKVYSQTFGWYKSLGGSPQSTLALQSEGASLKLLPPFQCEPEQKIY
jgi:hypothetical protein